MAKSFTWKGFHITGTSGDWHSYAAGQDISAPTIAEIKKKIGRLEFAGLSVPKQYRARRPKRSNPIASHPKHSSILIPLIVIGGLAWLILRNK